MKSLNFTIILLVILVLLSFAGVNAQVAGTLDPSFGSGGIASTQIDGQVSDMAIQPDNKIVLVAGNIIYRFNQDGSLDPTFHHTNNFPFYTPQAIKILPDGKILFSGHISVQNTGHFCLGRLNPDGSNDTTFAGNGVVTTQTGIESQFRSINILPDGKILAAGWTSLQTTFNRDFAMVKYNSDGTLDMNFGSSGRIATELGGNEFSYDSAIQPDGKIILVGDCPDALTTQARAGIVRYNSDGTLDTGFGNNGKVFKFTAANGKADDVELQSDGKIIITGYHLVPTRYNSNGTLDAEFNNPAWVTSDSVAIQSNGKILISASTTSPEIITATTSLARYNSDLTLDNTFGAGGIVTNTGGMRAHLLMPTKILLAPDGKIVMGGTRSNPTELILARFLNNGPPFMDYDGDSKTDVSIFRPSNGQWWFLRSSDNSNYALQFGISTDKIVPADYTGDGKTDVAVYRASAGEWYILRSEDFSYYAFPFGISTDLPAPADFDGDKKADPAVFRPSTGTWYILKSSGGLQITPFGSSTSRPIPSDFDGDGKADIAVYDGSWWILQSSDGQASGQHLANGGNGNYSGDYTGDGKADVATFSNQFNAWYIRPSENPNAVYSVVFGTSSDILVPGDYDGDGKYDQAYFRPSNNTWNIRRSTGGTVQYVFGTSGDIPTPRAFVP